MLELLQTLSDDQTALLGCGVAFLGATLMLAMSFHANPKNKETPEIGSSSVSIHEETAGEREQRRAA